MFIVLITRCCFNCYFSTYIIRFRTKGNPVSSGISIIVISLIIIVYIDIDIYIYILLSTIRILV